MQFIIVILGLSVFVKMVTERFNAVKVFRNIWLKTCSYFEGWQGKRENPSHSTIKSTEAKFGGENVIFF